MFVAAKDLSDNKVKILKLADSDGKDGEVFYQIFSGSKYCLFRPKDRSDFKEKCHYGLKKGEEMRLYYILGMETDEMVLSARVSDKDHPERIRNSRRLSSGLSKIPLRQLTFNEEQEQALKEKEVNVKKSKADAKRRTESLVANDSIVAVDPSSDEENAVKPADVADSIINKEDGKEPSCPGNCYLSQYLMEEVKDLKRQLGEKNSSSEKAEPDVKRRKRLHSDGISVVSPNKAIGDDEYHFGDGVFVKIDEIFQQCECETWDARKRLAILMKLMWPEDYHLRTRNPGKVVGGKPITDDNILVIKNVLKCMAWQSTEKESLTLETVKGWVRRVTEQLRRKKDFEQMSTPDKAALEAKKKQQREAQRLRQQKKKEAKKADPKQKSKSKKNAVTSSSGMSESDTE